MWDMCALFTYTLITFTCFVGHVCCENNSYCVGNNLHLYLPTFILPASLTLIAIVLPTELEP